MAIAERVLGAEFNRAEFPIVDHRTYVFLGDGCLMEGISHEACALAGTLGLSKLLAIYDDNGISIDSEKGEIRQWYTDDVKRRFQAYGWRVIGPVDGHDFEAISRAVSTAKREKSRPTLICARTTIAKGAPTKANTGAAHGAPLGEKEVAATRAAIGWPHPPFDIPQRVYEGWDGRKRGAAAERRWTRLFAAYEKEYPAEAAEFRRRAAGDLPRDWQARCEALLAAANASAESIATRKASQNAIEALGILLPELIGGSADLAGSNLTLWSGSKAIGKAGGGNYIFFGVREFGMAAIVNGIALHGGLIPYGATFLVFSDYARNALRVAALMKIRAVFVFTHDSIGLGEDGPTHQPVEHAATLRLIPSMDVWRPCDSVEAAAAWIAAIERRHGPTSLLFSRQNLPFQPRSSEQIAAIARGGYVLKEAAAPARAVIIATGSEVQLALAAQRELAAESLPVRVVSMPSTTMFDRQDQAWRDAVLPPGLPRIAVEAGVSDYWRKYVGLEGAVIGLDSFGESAPAKDVFEHFGFTGANVAQAVKSVVERTGAPDRAAGT
jgi:transketolase